MTAYILWFHSVLPLNELNGRQERSLAISLGILHLGTGLSYSLLALNMIRYAHVSVTAYGAGMSVAALLGIASNQVMGSLTDRVNGYRLYALLVWVMSVATASVAAGWPAK
jgi:hypothetical protein